MDKQMNIEANIFNPLENLRERIDTLKCVKLDNEFISQLNITLDKIIASSYWSKPASFSRINVDELSYTLEELLDLIPTNNEHALAKYCQIAKSYNQKVTLHKSYLKRLINYLLPKLTSSSHIIFPDILSTISCLLEFLPIRGDDFGFDKLENIIKLASHEDMNTQFWALQAITNFVHKQCPTLMLSDKDFNTLYQIFLAELKGFERTHSSTFYSKKIFISMKGLASLITTQKRVPKDLSNGILLGLVKVFIFLGLPGYNNLTPIFLNPVPMPIPDASMSEDEEVLARPGAYQKTKRKKGKRKFLAKQQYDSSTLGDETKDGAGSSSDSGFRQLRPSSSESETEGSILKKLHTSIRQYSFILLQSLIKFAPKKLIFGYWPLFFPDSTNVHNMPNLFTSIFKDQSIKVRAEALQTIGQYIENSKQLLAMAEFSQITTRSFIPLSINLGLMIADAHKHLFKLLSVEKSSFILIHLLKCLLSLVSNVPYGHNGSDLLELIIQHIKNFLLHKDPQVQVACIALYGALVAIKPRPPVLNDIGAFTFIHTKAMVLSSNIQLPVRLESLQAITSIIEFDLPLIRLKWKEINELLISCLESSDQFLQLHGTKVLEALSISTSKIIKEDKQDEALLDDLKMFWPDILERILTLLSKAPHASVQTGICDAMSTISPTVIKSIEEWMLISLVTTLLSLATESETSIQASAVRCLGIFVLLPVLNDDTHFFLDATDVICEALHSDSLLVKNNASWALSTITDALFIEREEAIPNKYLILMANTAIEASQEKDRIKINGIRALGNILRYCPQESLKNSTMHEVVLKSIDLLKAGLKSKVMKVRWNSCYAFKNVFENSALDFLNMPLIIEELMNILKFCDHFKVRINAVQALRSLHNLEEDKVADVWLKLLEALKRAQHCDNFAEVRHQKNLQEQISLTLYYFIKLFTPKLFSILESATLPYHSLILPPVEPVPDLVNLTLTGFLENSLAQLLLSNINAQVANIQL